MSLNLGKTINQNHQMNSSIEEVIFDCIDLEERINDYCTTIVTIENAKQICNLTENKSQEIVNFAEELLGCSLEAIKHKIFEDKIGSDRDAWAKNGDALLEELKEMLPKLKEKFDSLISVFGELSNKSSIEFKLTPSIKRVLQSFDVKGFREYESKSDGKLTHRRNSFSYYSALHLAKEGSNMCSKYIDEIKNHPFKMYYTEGKKSWHTSVNMAKDDKSHQFMRFSATYGIRNIARLKRNVSNLRKLLAALLLCKRQYANG